MSRHTRLASALVVTHQNVLGPRALGALAGHEGDPHPVTQRVPVVTLERLVIGEVILPVLAADECEPFGPMNGFHTALLSQRPHPSRRSRIRARNQASLTTSAGGSRARTRNSTARATTARTMLSTMIPPGQQNRAYQTLI